MASARMVVSSRCWSSAAPPLLRCLKWREKPVQLSTSSSSSVTFRWGSLAEQRPHEPVVQVDYFVDQRGAGVEHHRHQRGVAAGRFQVTQVLRRHLPAFAGELQQPVLVDGVFQSVR